MQTNHPFHNSGIACKWLPAILVCSTCTFASSQDQGEVPDLFQLLNTLDSQHVFVDAFHEYVQPQDLNNDGFVSDLEFMEFILDPLVFTNTFDLNGDGIVDESDDELALRNILMAMLGDRTLDGSVGVADLEILLQDNYVETGSIERARADGVLPSEFSTLSNPDVGPPAPPPSIGDVEHVSRNINDNTQQIVDEIIDTRRELLLAQQHGGFEAQDDEYQLMGDEDIAGIEEYPHHQFFSDQYPGRKRPAHYPPNHAVTVTAEWGEHRTNFSSQTGRHDLWVSNQFWPANHLNDISYGWRISPGDHQKIYSRLTWPPNHLVVPSHGWPAPGDSIPAHDSATSKSWPPSHTVSNSNSSEHRQDWSAAYPEESFPVFIPPIHSQIISGTHPGNHYIQTSNTIPGTHDEALSGYGWPPNHTGTISVGWTPGNHTYALSAGWPPNHYHTMSRGWPDDGWPGWPANHTADWSGGMTPDEFPDFFPPDHNMLSTAQDLKDLILP